MTIEELNSKVMEWSGFKLEGETKMDLKRRLNRIKYDLECELHQQTKAFEKLIDSLELEEEF